MFPTFSLLGAICDVVHSRLQEATIVRPKAKITAYIAASHFCSLKPKTKLIAKLHGKLIFKGEMFEPVPSQ
jgi:hypothetical protein